MLLFCGRVNVQPTASFDNAANGFVAASISAAAELSVSNSVAASIASNGVTAKGAADRSARELGEQGQSPGHQARGRRHGELDEPWGQYERR